MTDRTRTTGTPPDGLGVYLHVPFCASRCDYCAFATWTDRFDLVEAYVDACLTDMTRARADGRLVPAATCFVGGGTPSLLGPRLLTRLLGGVELLPDAEVTVECNPESTDAALLRALRDCGVTRISLGVQSLRPRVLAGLGRNACVSDAAATVEAIGDAGFSTFNVDLIYGGAGERDEDWAATLDGVLAFAPAPPHVSAYALTVEPGTPLARDPARHPDEDVQADRYLAGDARLGAAGLSWYEISNWARPGHECRHNLACWRGGEYLGFGCAAHSHLEGRRFSNVRTPERYVARVAAGDSPVAHVEELSAKERALEALGLALRTRDGVPSEALSKASGVDHLVNRSHGRAVLTRRGRLLANEVALRLTVPPAPGHPYDHAEW